MNSYVNELHIYSIIGTSGAETYFNEDAYSRRCAYDEVAPGRWAELDLLGVVRVVPVAAVLAVVTSSSE